MSFEPAPVFDIDDVETMEMLADPTRLEILELTMVPRSVSEIAEAADPTSGTFEVEVSVADADRLLKAGFIARVDLLPSDTEPLFFIPIEALVEGDGRDGIVYAVEPASQTARRMPVRIAEILGNEVAVTAGLDSVAAVVTEGAPYLSDGARIQVVD